MSLARGCCALLLWALAAGCGGDEDPSSTTEPTSTPVSSSSTSTSTSVAVEDSTTSTSFVRQTSTTRFEQSP